jgi:hypothetical protein
MEAAVSAREVISAVITKVEDLHQQLEVRTAEMADLRHELIDAGRRANAQVARLREMLDEAERGGAAWKDRAVRAEEMLKGLEFALHGVREGRPI